MVMIINKEHRRVLRQRRIRKKICGTTAQPRLCVHRSHKNFYAQVIDDSSGKVLCSMSTLAKDLRNQIKTGGDLKAAETLGEVFARELKKKGIQKIAFDRGGYLYHGRVKAFAESARKGGLEF